MAAPAWKANGTWVQNVISSSGIDTPNLTLPLPAGWADGDFALAMIQNDNLDTLSAPTGWTKITQANTAVSSGSLYYKRLTTGDTDPTWTSPSHAGATNRQVFIGQIATFTGVLATGTPYEGLATLTGNTTPSAALATVTTGIDRLVVHGWALSEIQANTPPTGWTEWFDQGTGSGDDGHICLQGIAQATAGTRTADARAFTVTTTPYAAIGIALLPVAAAGFTSTFWVRSAGTWKQVSPLHVKSAGTWKQVQELHVRSGGVWKRIM